MTAAEKVLWQALRRKQLDGLSFRRQVALGPYILDFICTEKRLVIEVDGNIHDEQIDYDAARTEHLEQYGYRVLRIRNEEVINRLDTVLTRISAAAATHRPSRWTD